MARINERLSERQSLFHCESSTRIVAIPKGVPGPIGVRVPLVTHLLGEPVRYSPPKRIRHEDMECSLDANASLGSPAFGANNWSTEIRRRQSRSSTTPMGLRAATHSPACQSVTTAPTCC